MYHINLKNLEFFAFHGYYQEENLIGNNFTVDIKVSVIDEIFEHENLASIINYELIYEIVKTEMNQTQKLLETVLQNIENAVRALSIHIRAIEIHLTKQHLPIDGFIGQAMVSLTKEYES